MTPETSTTTALRRRTVTAFFDDRSEAEKAVERLVSAGVDRSNVNVRFGSGSTTASSTTTTASTTSGTGEVGFWDSLKDLFLPDDDRSAYAEGLRRGGFLVTATVTDAQYERALDILDDEGTVHLEERVQGWQREGWTGYAGSDRTVTTGTGATGLGALGATGTAATTGTRTTATAAAATGTTALETGREEAIPVVEERLRVGKREIEHGRVRVRSYVVETPVEEQVALRQEHVHVERRSVDRPVTDADALFQDRVIEATETAEEAVIAKEARVREELVIKKDAEQRTQTVSDTVRRTEVEVEDERGRTTRTGTTGVEVDTTTRR